MSRMIEISSDTQNRCCALLVDYSDVTKYRHITTVEEVLDELIFCQASGRVFVPLSSLMATVLLATKNIQVFGTYEYIWHEYSARWIEMPSLETAYAIATTIVNRILKMMASMETKCHASLAPADAKDG